MNFRFHAVQIVNQIFLARDSLQKRRLIVGGKRLAPRSPSISMDETKIGCEDAIHERDIAAHHRILDLLFEREDFRGSRAFFCGGLPGSYDRQRGEEDESYKPPFDLRSR